MSCLKSVVMTLCLAGLAAPAYGGSDSPQMAPFLIRIGAHDITVPCIDIETDLRTFYESDLDRSKLRYSFTYSCSEEYKRYAFELIVEARTIGDVEEMMAYARLHNEHEVDGSNLVLERSLGEFLTMSFSPRKLASPDEISTYRPIGETFYKTFFWTHRGYSDFRDSFAEVFYMSPTDWKALANWTAVPFGKPYGEWLLEEGLPAVDWIYVLFDNTFIMADGSTYQFYKESFEFDCRETRACLDASKVKTHHLDISRDKLVRLLSTDSKAVLQP